MSTILLTRVRKSKTIKTTNGMKHFQRQDKRLVFRSSNFCTAVQLNSAAHFHYREWNVSITSRGSARTADARIISKKYLTRHVMSRLSRLSALAGGQFNPLSLFSCPPYFRSLLPFNIFFSYPVSFLNYSYILLTLLLSYKFNPLIFIPFLSRF